MIERVDPYDHAVEPTSWARRTYDDSLRSRLEDLRARIAELDAQMAGLLARREELTRAVFDMAAAGGAGGG